MIGHMTRTSQNHFKKWKTDPLTVKMDLKNINSLHFLMLKGHVNPNITSLGGKTATGSLTTKIY